MNVILLNQTDEVFKRLFLLYLSASVVTIVLSVSCFSSIFHPSKSAPQNEVFPSFPKDSCFFPHIFACWLGKQVELKREGKLIEEEKSPTDSGIFYLTAKGKGKEIEAF